MPRTIGVYAITCRPSGRTYIGSSVHCGARLREHRYQLRRGAHACHTLQDDYTRYGPDQFAYQIVETCAVDELVDVERAVVARQPLVYNRVLPTRPHLAVDHYDPDQSSVRHYRAVAARLAGRTQSPEHKANRQRAIDEARARGFVRH